MDANITEDESKPPRGYTYKAHHDDVEIGRATLYILENELHSRPFGLLEDVFVNEKYRGSGVGTQLTEHVIKKARDHGCYKLICTSRYTKPKVHQLYTRLGFKDHGKEFRIDYFHSRHLD